MRWRAACWSRSIADKHIAYGVNDCVVDAVERYLIELVVPADGLVCD